MANAWSLNKDELTLTEDEKIIKACNHFVTSTFARDHVVLFARSESFFGDLVLDPKAPRRDLPP